MAIKRALRLRVEEVVSGAGLKTLKSPPVESGQIWCFQQVAWEIDKATSGGNTRCRLYIEGHGYNHYLAGQDAPTADSLYTYTKKPYLIPRERLCLEIDQAQASTTAKMHITGYSTEFKEGIVT